MKIINKNGVLKRKKNLLLLKYVKILAIGEYFVSVPKIYLKVIDWCIMVRTECNPYFMLINR